MNNSEYQGIIQQVKDGFQRNKGRGYCFITKPVSTTVVLFDIIVSLINKRPLMKILIVLKNYYDKEELVESFKMTDRTVFLDNIKCFFTHYHIIGMYFLHNTLLLLEGHPIICRG